MAPNRPLKILDAEGAATLNPLSLVDSIIWGWKRDSENSRLSRIVYFSGTLMVNDEGVWLAESFLFYTHLGAIEAMAPVVAALKEGEQKVSSFAEIKFEVLLLSDTTLLLRIVSGRPSKEDLDRLERLVLRQPAPPRVTPPHQPSELVFDLKAHGITDCDLLAGSGLSYEAGLPMSKEIHDLFWVDDGDTGFCLGPKDQLPQFLKDDLRSMFKRFSAWHIQAAKARPSEAHTVLSDLRKAGFLHHVYTDNIDKLFDLVGIDDYTRVRGSGVINEFYPVDFHPQSNALLVVGVSADRRGIIAQAREKGLKLVIVNPYHPVSPGAKNLDYLDEGDIYFRLSAGEALPKIVENTIGTKRG